MLAVHAGPWTVLLQEILEVLNKYISRAHNTVVHGPAWTELKGLFLTGGNHAS